MNWLIFIRIYLPPANADDVILGTEWCDYRPTVNKRLLGNENQKLITLDINEIRIYIKAKDSLVCSYILSSPSSNRSGSCISWQRNDYSNWDGTFFSSIHLHVAKRDRQFTRGKQLMDETIGYGVLTKFANFGVVILNILTYRKHYYKNFKFCW